MHSQVLCADGDEVAELALLHPHLRMILGAVTDYPVVDAFEIDPNFSFNHLNFQLKACHS